MNNPNQVKAPSFLMYRRYISEQRRLILKVNFYEGLILDLESRGKSKNIDSIKGKIEKLTTKVQALDSKIKAYYDELHIHQDHRLEHLKQRVSVEKNKDRIENQIDYLETYHKAFELSKIQLSVSKLKMYFGGVKAINDLSFDVHEGEIFGLIGPNGAGKTTVFNCITQFYRPTSGNILFRNKEGHLVNLNRFKPYQIVNEGIARSFQNVELIWELNVLDNLLVAAHSLNLTNYFDHMFHTPKMKKEETILRAKGFKILQELGIADYAFRFPLGLPYGILKKIELARTLMTNPSLIILDEPAAGLNDAETEELAKTIKHINKTMGVTIFLVEHDMGLVMSICDRICAISFGRLIGIGTPKEIQENPEVRKAYLGDDDDE